MYRLIAQILMVFLLWGSASAGFWQNMGGVSTSQLDYCSSTTWNTLNDFRLDFDHPDSPLLACLSSGTLAGTGDYTGTPVPTSPGSGGLALIADAAGEKIAFDNTGYFSSAQGTIRFKAKISTAITSYIDIIDIIAVAAQDRIQVQISNSSRLIVLWEDNNAGLFTLISGVGVADFSQHLGKWGEFEIKWDTGRCATGDAACSDTGKDELCLSARWDDNSDGDFLDGGSENWTTTCETSTKNLEPWSIEPGLADVEIGVPVSFTEIIMIDDVEISPLQPVW